MRDDIKAALLTFKPSEPIYRVSKGWDDNTCTLQKAGRPQSSDNGVVAAIIAGQVSEKYDWYSKEHRIQTDLDNYLETARYSAHNKIRNFINRHQKAKNKKLTALYKWWHHAVSTYVIKANPELENDIWNIFKWMSTMDNPTQEQQVAALHLLDAIRQRYEAKGIVTR
jgi:hypothetical protein